MKTVQNVSLFYILSQLELTSWHMSFKRRPCILLPIHQVQTRELALKTNLQKPLLFLWKEETQTSPVVCLSYKCSLENHTLSWKVKAFSVFTQYQWGREEGLEPFAVSYLTSIFPLPLSLTLVDNYGNFR